jgi:acetyltransferase-like isoleucine patch superfamily enzyme
MLTGINPAIRFLRNPNPWISVKLLRSFGAKAGKGTTIKRSLYIDNSFEDLNSTGDFSNLELGENCYIGDMVYFDLSNKIIIEDNAILAGKVSVITHSDCNRSEYLSEKFPRKSAPVIIKNGSWIGYGSTILAGVIIGEKSVIGANSLVIKDVEPYSVYSGTPATKQKSI